MGNDIWTLLGMLAAVVAILALAYWATKFIARRSMTMNMQNGAGSAEDMCVLGQINLGKGERLVLIRLHERCLLLGATENSISLITELSEEESQIWITEAEQAPAPPSFFEALKSNISKKK